MKSKKEEPFKHYLASLFSRRGEWSLTEMRKNKWSGGNNNVR